MTDDSVLQRHTLRLAMIAIGIAKLEDQYKAVQAEAAPDFAAARNRGITQQRVILPGGADAGLFSFYSGGKSVEVDEDELLLHVALTEPGEIEDYVTEAALHDKRVLDLLAEHLPEFVARRVKTPHRAQLQKELEEHDGYVADPSTGEKVKVATVTPLPASGKFRYNPDKQAAIRIAAAIEAGTLTSDGQVVALQGGAAGE
jgi:hypothetical protein